MLRRTIWIALWTLLLSMFGLAQSTTVSGNLADVNSQAAFGASYTITFSGPSGATWTGGPLTTVFTGTTDASANFSISIPSNNAITPSGTGWIFTFCPKASVPCTNFGPIFISGATQVITSQIVLPAMIMPPTNIQKAYNNVEIQQSAAVLPGSLYWDLTLLASQQWNGTSWVGIGSGGGGGNLSNSGTPLIHQTGIFVDATHVKGIGPCATNQILNGITSADPTCGTLPTAALASPSGTGTKVQTTNLTTTVGGDVATYDPAGNTQDSGRLLTSLVTSVTGTAPVASSGGPTPAISITGITGIQGNGTSLQAATGTGTTNFLPKFDANLNLVNSLFKDGITANLGQYDGTAGFAVSQSGAALTIGGTTVPAVIGTATGASAISAAGTGAMTPTASAMATQWNGLCWLYTGNNSAVGCLPTTVTSQFAISSSGQLSFVGSANIRTWTTPYQSVCQGGVASAPIIFDTTNGPTLVACAAGQLDGDWQEASGSTNAIWYIRFVVPTGQTGNYTLVFKYRTADTVTSDAVTMPYSYTCVTDGTVPTSSLTFTSLGTLTLNPQGTANATKTVTTTGIAMTCAAGNEIYIKFTYSATAFTINHNYVSLSTSATL